MSWSVVVPSNRPARLAEFCEAWEEQFITRDVALFVVFDGEDEDAPDLHESPDLRYVFLDTWETIPDWIPRRTDMIRSWGMYRAWAWDDGSYIVSMDDDVRPESGVDLLAEYERVFARGAVVSDYLDVGGLTDSGLQMRGFPKRDRRPREVAVQYGGWSGVLDYDAETQLAGVPEHAEFLPVVLAVPRGVAVTGCAMNMAWKGEYTPIMWQLPLFEGRYNRFGDIWAGLLAKRACDQLEKAVVVNGRARVRHSRASDPRRNLELEAPGLVPNEGLWEALCACWMSYRMPDISHGYREMLEGFMRGLASDPEYVAHFRVCADHWLDLFVTDDR